MLQLLRRSASPALLAGGGLMIAAEVIVWIVGFQTGKLAPKLGMNAPYFLTHIGYLASEVPVLLLGVGLWGMYAQLDGRAKGLGITGVVLATLSMITAVGALAIPGNGSNSLVGAVGGITLVLGTGLLTVASLRAGDRSVARSTDPPLHRCPVHPSPLWHAAPVRTRLGIGLRGVPREWHRLRRDGGEP